MPQSKLNTEAQQIAIDLIIHVLNEACEPLFKKKKEFELLDETEEVKLALLVINMRLDTLGKVHTKLLEPVKTQYMEMESHFKQKDSNEYSAELIRPSDMLNSLRAAFVGAIMQGL